VTLGRAGKVCNASCKCRREEGRGMSRLDVGGDPS
jgi:hypothetical protein